MLPAIVTVVGQIVAAIGAWVLWKYGIPARNRTNGVVTLAIETDDVLERAVERRFDDYAFVGFWAGAGGVLLQVVGTLLPLWL